MTRHLGLLTSLVVAGAVLSGCGAKGPTDGAITYVAATSTGLDVTYSGQCPELDRVEVQESAERVALAVHLKPTADCSDLADRSLTASVTLATPLGSREVTNLSGEPVNVVGRGEPTESTRDIAPK